MLKFTKKLFGGGIASPALPDDVAQALDLWRNMPAAPRDGAHFHTRYVALDVATAGLQAEDDALLGIAGVGIVRGGLVLPDDAFALDLPSEEPLAADQNARQLMAVLQFSNKAPLVTYQAPFVGGFLEKALADGLGVNFQPEWIDLAWLLPDLFSEKIDEQVSMDVWLGAFGIEIPGRRDALSDALAMARLFQVALPRAVERGADTPGKLVDIAKARRWLRNSG